MFHQGKKSHLTLFCIRRYIMSTLSFLNPLLYQYKHFKFVEHKIFLVKISGEFPVTKK